MCSTSVSMDEGVAVERPVALVTGAGQGLGAAIAHGLARRRFYVVANDINPAAAERTAEALRAAGGAGQDVAQSLALALVRGLVDVHRYSPAALAHNCRRVDEQDRVEAVERDAILLPPLDVHDEGYLAALVIGRPRHGGGDARTEDVAVAVLEILAGKPPGHGSLLSSRPNCPGYLYVTSIARGDGRSRAGIASPPDEARLSPPPARPSPPVPQWCRPGGRPVHRADRGGQCQEG